jgi:hypothetical protein
MSIQHALALLDSQLKDSHLSWVEMLDSANYFKKHLYWNTIHGGVARNCRRLRDTNAREWHQKPPVWFVVESAQAMCQ